MIGKRLEEIRASIVRIRNVADRMQKRSKDALDQSDLETIVHLLILVEEALSSITGIEVDVEDARRFLARLTEEGLPILDRLREARRTGPRTWEFSIERGEAHAAGAENDDVAAAEKP